MRKSRRDIFHEGVEGVIIREADRFCQENPKLGVELLSVERQKTFPDNHLAWSVKFSRFSWAHCVVKFDWDLAGYPLEVYIRLATREIPTKAFWDLFSQARAMRRFATPLRREIIAWLNVWSVMDS